VTPSKINPSGASTVVNPIDSVVGDVKAPQFRTAKIPTIATTTMMRNVRRYMTASLSHY
jgi:hypothetical protein